MIYNKTRQLCFCSIDRQTFLGFEMTSNSSVNPQTEDSSEERLLNCEAPTHTSTKLLLKCDETSKDPQHFYTKKDKGRT